MSELIGIEDFLYKNRELPIVDVRAPIEYTKGHIPGAINIPLFTDRERASVGICYKNEGHDSAVELGLAVHMFNTLHTIANEVPRHIIEFVLGQLVLASHVVVEVNLNAPRHIDKLDVVLPARQEGGALFEVPMSGEDTHAGFCIGSLRLAVEYPWVRR